ncbi:hypothetical protein BH20ACI3_BH20ACI3_03250 [soil metagenome]
MWESEARFGHRSTPFLTLLIKWQKACTACAGMPCMHEDDYLLSLLPASPACGVSAQHAKCMLRVRDASPYRDDVSRNFRRIAPPPAKRSPGSVLKTAGSGVRRFT